MLCNFVIRSDTFCSRSDTFRHAFLHDLQNADTFRYVLFNSLTNMLKSYFGHKFRTDCRPSPWEGPSCQDSPFVTLRYVPVRSGIRSGTCQSGNPFYTRMVYPQQTCKRRSKKPKWMETEKKKYLVTHGWERWHRRRPGGRGEGYTAAARRDDPGERRETT